MTEERTKIDQAWDHIRKYEGQVTNRAAPWELTQEGVAETLGINRSHASVVLNTMERRGTALCLKRYVDRGALRLRKVYITNLNGSKHVGDALVLPASKALELQEHIAAIGRILGPAVRRLPPSMIVASDYNNGGKQ